MAETVPVCVRHESGDTSLYRIRNLYVLPLARLKSEDELPAATEDDTVVQLPPFTCC